jgi:hypothetical protein
MEKDLNSIMNCERHNKLSLLFGYNQCLVIPKCKLDMTSLRGRASKSKMTSLGGQANGTGMPPDQISKQS